jgi:Reverse transcriptase (RNA-dependent DNA polymerase)
MGKIMIPSRATGSFCCFMDDSLIYTTSAEKHLQRLDQFVHIPIENGWKLSVKKTFFMQHEIRFMGVDFTQDCIKVPVEINRALDRLQTLKMTSVKPVQ